MKKLFCTLLVFTLILITIPVFAGEGYLTVVMYHRFDAASPISISFDKFKQQIGYLQDNGYQFLSLKQVEDHLENGKSFPEKSVLLTVDDGYRSTYTHAFPYLQKQKIPWVLYVYTDAIDGGYGSFLSWDQIKEMAEAGVAIENHTASHPRFTKVKDKNDTWIEKEILAPHRRLREKTGRESITLALPYGAYDMETLKILREKTDYSFIMTTDPGVVSAAEKPFLLARMGLAGSTSMEKFKNKVNRQYLAVEKIDIAPGQRLVSSPDEINIKLADAHKDISGPINVFISELGAQSWEWTDREQGKLRVHVDGKITRLWNRLIITAFDKKTGKYRFYSQGIVFEG